jgi:type IX secretion system PorP/SprF family membrane protein
MNNMKKFYITISLVMAFAAARAQNESLISHYLVAPILINPAVAGFKETHQIVFNARTQWTSFPDAPKSLGVQYHGPIGKTFGLGVGVSSESAARLNLLKFRLNYAFRFDIQETVKLAIGFSTEYQQLRLGSNILSQPIYDFDDILNGAIEGRQVFDASFGIFGTFNEQTFAGISFANLIRARLDDIVSSGDESSFLKYYLIYAGHKLIFNDGAVSVEPSLLLRQIQDAPFQADVNLKLGFMEDRFIAGLSYRSLKTIGFLFGSEFSESFRLFYSFDMTLQDIQQFSAGGHEISIGVGLNSPDKSRSLRRR